MGGCRAREFLLGASALPFLLSCGSSETYELALELDEGRDLAFLLLVDAQGSLARDPIRAEAGVAIETLRESEVGAWVLGFSADALPPAARFRIDVQAFDEAKLVVGVPDGPSLEPGIHLSKAGGWMELVASADAPHFERSLPLDLGVGASSIEFPKELVLRLRQNGDFCPDGTLNRIDGEKIRSLQNHPADVRQIEPIFPGQFLLLIPGLFIRYHVATSSVGSHDVRGLPPPLRTELPLALWTQQVAILPEVNGRRRVLLAMREQSGDTVNTGRLFATELGPETSWQRAPLTEVDFGLYGDDGLLEPILGMAASPLGDLLMVGGSERESRYAGFLGLLPAGASDLSFERVSILVGGSDNGDKFETVAAAPVLDRSLFAVSTGSGELILLERRPGSRTLQEVERHQPRSEFEGRIRFQRLRFIETARGLELWGLADKNLLVRRRADGTWEEFGALIERSGVEDEVFDCGPFAFPGPIQWNDVARERNTLIFSRLGCAGLLRVELDEDDEIRCVGALPVQGERLSVTAMHDFNALLAHDGRLFAGGFRLLSVFEAELDP